MKLYSWILNTLEQLILKIQCDCQNFIKADIEDLNQKTWIIFCNFPKSASYFSGEEEPSRLRYSANFHAFHIGLYIFCCLQSRNSARRNQLVEQLFTALSMLLRTVFARWKYFGTRFWTLISTVRFWTIVIMSGGLDVFGTFGNVVCWDIRNLFDTLRLKRSWKSKWKWKEETNEYWKKILWKILILTLKIFLVMKLCSKELKVIMRHYFEYIIGKLNTTMLL